CKQALSGPKGVGSLSRSASPTALVILAICAACLAIPPPTKVEASRTDAASKVIIAIDPARKSQLYWFLRTVLGKAKGEKIGQTQSEVWVVPTPQLARLALMLRVFGSRLTRIPDDFNQLFKWQKDLSMSVARDEMVKEARL